ncbi:MAG: muconolactone Delta-isomerase family protein [Acidobacteriota bacterium]
MQFLTVSIRRDGAEGAGSDLRYLEIERARQLYMEGYIRQLWHRADAPGACVLWEAEDEGHMQELLDSLPFVRARLVEVTVVALRPYAGFGPNRQIPSGGLHDEQ